MLTYARGSSLRCDVSFVSQKSGNDTTMSKVNSPKQTNKQKGFTCLIKKFKILV